MIRIEEMTPAQKMVLAINRTSKHIYSGSVPQHVIERRRAASKIARKSRRANRSK